jgi:hypothetical protein
MITPALYGCEGNNIQEIKFILWQDIELLAHVCTLPATELLVNQCLLACLNSTLV